METKLYCRYRGNFFTILQKFWIQRITHDESIDKKKFNIILFSICFRVNVTDLLRFSIILTSSIGINFILFMKIIKKISSFNIITYFFKTSVRTHEHNLAIFFTSSCKTGAAKRIPLPGLYLTQFAVSNKVQANQLCFYSIIVSHNNFFLVRIYECISIKQIRTSWGDLIKSRYWIHSIWKVLF